MNYSKFLFIFLFILTNNTFLIAQEICNNGIDDDNDGLIDLNDNDCFCNKSLDLSKIPNPSLEDRICCPKGLEEMNCVEAWEQGSFATTDYFNSCGITSYLNGVFDKHSTIFPPFPSKPFPDGDGFAGILSVRSNYKEYLAVCLNEPLYKDSIYFIEFHVGFGVKGENTYPSLPELDLSIFGTSNCNNIPFAGLDCLTKNNSDWQIINNKTISGEEEWKLVKIKLKPLENIEAIAIGSSCVDFAENYASYYFLDRVLLVEEKDSIALSTIGIKSGLPCQSNVVLQTTEYKEAIYQWYYNGIAIKGANQRDYNVPSESEGIYEVVVELNGNCILTKPYDYKIEGFPKAILGKDTFLCENEYLILGERNSGDSFIWSTGEESKTIQIEKPGLYSVLVSNECGENYEEITVSQFDVEPDCDMIIANVFTPNNDGKNDAFKIVSDCCFVNFNLKIFNRWGKSVFESNNSTQEWDGGNFPSGVYVWRINYSWTSLENVLNSKKKGNITLIR